MEERIARFIAALRAEGTRISLAESADAFAAVEELGVLDRNTFRLALRSALIKDHRAQPTFDALFPLFFAGGAAPPGSNLLETLGQEELEHLAEWLKGLPERLRQRLQELLEGRPLDERELEDLANRLGLSRVDSLQYHQWLARRVERALGLDELLGLLEQLAMALAQASGTPSGRAGSLEAALRHNLEAWQDQILQFVGRRIAENLSEARPAIPEQGLLDVPFSALTETEMSLLRDEARRLAILLRSKIALRQKKDRSGTLDPKSTIRSNLKYSGVPIEIRRRKRVRRPRLVILCDISTSMRYCSELMLTMLFHLSDLISKTHAFAFIDHLEFVSPDFAGRSARDAVRAVLERMPPGYYSTDLGASLMDFDRRYLDTMDRNTSFILVGDARNNYNNPQLGIFQKLARRARRTIWLNPESRSQWGSGDSDMLKYEPFCQDILKARNLRELSQAIDLLLS